MMALARELDHPFTLAFALCVAFMTHMCFLREFEAAQECVEPLVELSAKEGFVFFEPSGIIYRGVAQVEAGEVEEGIAQMLRGRGDVEATDIRAYRPMFLAVLAETYRKAGQVQQGLSLLDEALALIEKTDERFYEAESHRIKGELLLMQDNETEAEVSFRKSIEVAQRQEVRSWELRAAMSLSRLWQKQGKREEAHRLLSEIYNWFTEGFDTSDLREAKALLEELS